MVEESSSGGNSSVSPYKPSSRPRFLFSAATAPELNSRLYTQPRCVARCHLEQILLFPAYSRVTKSPSEARQTCLAPRQHQQNPVFYPLPKPLEMNPAPAKATTPIKSWGEASPLRIPNMFLLKPSLEQAQIHLGEHHGFMATGEEMLSVC